MSRSWNATPHRRNIKASDLKGFVNTQILFSTLDIGCFTAEIKGKMVLGLVFSDGGRYFMPFRVRTIKRADTETVRLYMELAAQIDRAFQAGYIGRDRQPPFSTPSFALSHPDGKVIWQIRQIPIPISLRANKVLIRKTTKLKKALEENTHQRQVVYSSVLSDVKELAAEHRKRMILHSLVREHPDWEVDKIMGEVEKQSKQISLG